MKKQPDWKLSVEGHTDNVGGDKHNLDLFQRHAASAASPHRLRRDTDARRCLRPVYHLWPAISRGA
jgi:hypothetical protein